MFNDNFPGHQRLFIRGFPFLSTRRSWLLPSADGNIDQPAADPRESTRVKKPFGTVSRRFHSRWTVWLFSRSAAI